VISKFSVLPGSAEALVWLGGKINVLIVAYFPSDISANNYKYQTIISQVTAKNVMHV